MDRVLELPRPRGFQTPVPSFVTTSPRQYVRYEPPVSYTNGELRRIARSARGHSGSLVVVLQKQKRNKYRRRVLRSLGLSRSHKAVVGPNESWFTGQLEKVLDQVYVGYLPAVDRDLVGSHKMKERRYSYERGEIAVFSEGQYLQVEVNGGTTSLFWPSVKPLDEILADLLATTGVEDERPAAVGLASSSLQIPFDPETENPDFDPNRSTVTNVTGLIELLRSDERSIAYIDIDMPSFVFTWTRDSRKFDVGGHAYPEVGLTYSQLPQSFDSEFRYIERTATPEVRAQAEAVLQSWPMVRPSSKEQ